MTDERHPAGGDEELNDPDLQALADAILEGVPVDWTRTPADADPALLAQLRVLAGLADVHRTPERHPDAADMPAPLGTWGPLTLLERIGRGAFGDVYRAWDTRLDREVALKLLHQPEQQASDQPRRSIQEGRLLARIRHPNVVTVYGAERIDGQTGIWTEFVHGETLAARLQARGPFPVSEAIAIGIDLCRALAAAHAVGLLHRDVKTQNVMREPAGRIVLVDFGASEDYLPSESTAPARPLTGTPLYLAPELWTGRSPSVETDTYSLGVLLYHLVTGSYPVQGASIDEIRKAHHSLGRTLLSAAGTGLPGSFVATVDRAIDPDPSRRFENARAFETALAESLGSAGAAAVVVDPPMLAQRPPRRRGSLTLAGLAVVAVISGVLLMTGNDDDVSLPAPPPPPAYALSRPFRGEALPPESPAASASQAPEITSQAPVTPRASDATAVADRSGQAPVTIGTPADDTPQPTFHSIRMIEGVASVGGPSRDGRHVPYIDASGDMLVWEKPTGHRTVVAKLGVGPGQFGPSLMSPEGDRIAFQWVVSDQVYELRIINADGSGPRILLPQQTELAPLPIEWSKDGRQVLCWLRKNTNQYWDLTLVPTDGGPPRVVRHFDGVPPVRASLSGDGRFVVYDLPAGPRSPRDLFIVGTDGSPPRVLLDGPSNDMRPLWTPNDGYVFFQSNRSGSDAGWIVPVADGAATGPPRMVAKDVSALSDWSMTDDGALYYPVQEPFSEDLSVVFDLSATSQPGEPVPFSTKVHGIHAGFSWSPDGESIAYVVSSPRDGFRLNPHPHSLWIRDRVSKIPREFSLHGALAFVAERPPRWAPDGSSVVVLGRSTENRWGYFRLDARTGASAPIFLVDGYRLPLVEWSPDGAALFYFDPLRGIVARELISGAETVAVSNQAWPSGQPGLAVGILSFVVSPDGRSVAFTARDKSGSVALIRQRVGGELRELVRVSATQGLELHGWTHDGKDLLYSEMRDGPKPRQLWRAPVDGTPPQRLVTPASLEESRAGYVSLSPDGRKLGYTDMAMVWDLCVLENFLPPDR